MKSLGFCLFFWLLLSPYFSYGAVGRSPDDINRDSYSCDVTVYINESVLFDNESQARSYCSTVYKIYKVDTGCLLRKFFTEEWESNFSIKKIFSGPDSVDQYKEWALEHSHKGYIIKHTVFYSGKCLEEYPSMELKF